MPIQNLGTLLENLVVTEAALTLLHVCHDRAPFDFVNSFAMPPSTHWCLYPNNSGFDDATLDRVRGAKDPALLQGVTYAGLLSANLRLDNGRGPNAALLVAGASLQTGVPCRMWLNDIRNGRYGDAISQLEQIEGQARAIYGIQDSNRTSLTVRVSDAAYPDSIMDLAKVLREWNPLPGARLGFLDPMRYTMQDRQAAETSSEDHRRWLGQIAFEGLTCAVQFTGNRDSPSLERELCSLHDDATAEGYAVSSAFKRQTYVAFLAIRSPVPEEPERVATEIEGRVRRAWDSWGQAFRSKRLKTPWQLKIYGTKSPPNEQNVPRRVLD